MIEKDDFFPFEEGKNNAKSGMGMGNEADAYEEIHSNSHEELLRAHAENENQRKRFKKEIDNAYKFAIQDFLTRILPVKDSIEKGLDVAYLEDGIDAETLFEGMKATLRICNDAFKAAGIEEIDPLGHTFDPELHEAIVVKSIEKQKPNIILSVFQKGYLLNGRLIRPARVEVSA